MSHVSLCRAAREPVVEVEPEVKNGHGHDGSRDQWGEAARRVRADGDNKSPRRCVTKVQ